MPNKSGSGKFGLAVFPHLGSSVLDLEVTIKLALFVIQGPNFCKILWGS